MCCALIFVVYSVNAMATQGYNLDFEPYPSVRGSVTNMDGLAYAAFMKTFADALHAQHLELSVVRA